MIERAFFALAYYHNQWQPAPCTRRQGGSIVVGELQPQPSSGLHHDAVANLAASIQQIK